MYEGKNVRNLAKVMDKSKYRECWISSQALVQKGTLHVVVDAYDDGYHRWWPRRVEVTEWGNSSIHWSKNWERDLGDAYYELYCEGARIGKTYTIKVEWRSRNEGKPQNNSWDRKFYSWFQTVTIDSLY